MKRAPLRFALAAGLLLMMSAPPARAQPSAHAVAAEELFRAGRDLIAEHRFKEACEKLDASEKLDPAVGTLFSLGECYLGEERFASAWFAFRAAVALAAQRNDLRRSVAEQRAAEIEPRLSTIVVRVSEDVNPREVISIDGEAFTRDALRAPIAVDPGTHAIAASAPGRVAWKTAVEIHVQTEQMEVPVPPLDLLPPVIEESHATKRALGIVSGAAGIVALGVGSILGVEAIAKGRDANRACPSGGACADAAAVHENNVAKTYADASTVTLPAGAVLVGVGAYLFFTSRRTGGPEVNAQVSSNAGRFDLTWAW